MKMKALWTTLLLSGCVLALAPDVAADSCNNTNYGVQVTTFIIADCESTSYTYVQYCHQQTGTGVGVGQAATGVGPGSSPTGTAAGEGTAGTHCTQSNPGGSDSEPGSDGFLPKL